MSLPGMPGLIAAYILLALLLLSINLYSRWSWPVKAGTIVVTTAFYLVTYFSLPQLLGWPTRDLLPERFHMVALYVQQPNKITRDEGAIYLWLTDADELGDAPRPRAFVLPYSPPLHELVMSAGARLSKGIAQLGEFKKPEEGALELFENPNRVTQISTHLKFYDTPDPMFPEK